MKINLELTETENGLFNGSFAILEGEEVRAEGGFQGQTSLECLGEMHHQIQREKFMSEVATQEERPLL